MGLSPPTPHTLFLQLFYHSPPALLLPQIAAGLLESCWQIVCWWKLIPPRPDCPWPPACCTQQQGTAKSTAGQRLSMSFILQVVMGELSCKSPSFSDRKHVAISGAWSTRLLYFITAQSASLGTYITQSGSCSRLFLPTHLFHLQYSIHGSKPQYNRDIWQAVGTYFSHVFEPSGQIRVNSRWLDRLHQASRAKLPPLREP